jgi:hypothetical protein
VSVELYDVSKVLPSLLSDSEVMNGVGSLSFTQKNKTVGKIYLNKGSIYAIDHVSYEHNLWHQLRFEEVLQHSNLRSLIRSNHTQRDSLYKLLKKVRSRKEDQVLFALKEYLLGAIDDLYQWKQVQVDWTNDDHYAYEAGVIPELALDRLVSIIATRESYKYEKYDAWGFKNDEQFIYGTVSISSPKTKPKYEAKSKLEEIILTAGTFIIKNIYESTGYSLFSLASTLDSLEEHYEIMIENPSGYQKPTLPIVPPGVSIVTGTAKVATGHGHFSETDEDADVITTFSNEYEVPEPARLDTQETFNEFTSPEEDENDGLESYNDLINDTGSMEVAENSLPPLKKANITTSPTRKVIPKIELLKEYEAQEDIAELYSHEVSLEKASESEATETAPIKNVETEQEKEPEIMSTTENSEHNTDILSLVQQIQEKLTNKKGDIDSINTQIIETETSINDLEFKLREARDKHQNLLAAKEITTSEYQKAVTALTSLA